MLIDWFTVLAQIVNFLILVWLLKRFLYKPILNAIDAREKKIAQELADADAKKAEALKEREEFQHKNEAFDQQRAAMLDKATAEAATERSDLLEGVRKEADNLRDKLQKKVSNEYQNLHEEFARRTQAEVFAIVRKTLTDLADVSLEQRMADVFIERLKNLDSGEKKNMAAMVKSPDMPILIRSAFELLQAQRTDIEKIIQVTLATHTTVRFEIVPDLIGGIELILHGQKVAWSVADHLATLESSVADLLKTEPSITTDTTPK